LGFLLVVCPFCFPAETFSLQLSAFWSLLCVSRATVFLTTFAGARTPSLAVPDSSLSSRQLSGTVLTAAKFPVRLPNWSAIFSLFAFFEAIDSPRKLSFALSFRRKFCFLTITLRGSRLRGCCLCSSWLLAAFPPPLLFGSEEDGLPPSPELAETLVHCSLYSLKLKTPVPESYRKEFVFPFDKEAMSLPPRAFDRSMKSCRLFFLSRKPVPEIPSDRCIISLPPPGVFSFFRQLAGRLVFLFSEGALFPPWPCT